MTISQRAQDVRQRLQQGKVGERVFVDPLDRIITLTNSDPQAAQVDTVTVTGAVNDTDYTATINGVAVTITSDGSATLIEIADALAVAINAEPLVRGQVAAVSDSVDTITLTGLLPGVAFTVTVGANLSTASVTAAAAADEVAFGLMLVTNGFDVDEPNDRLGAIAKSSSFTAQVDTGTVTFSAGQDYVIKVEHEDTEVIISEAADTNSDTTAGNIRTALTAALAALPITVSGATDEFILTADVAGDEFDTSIGQNVVLVTNVSTTTSMNRVAAGGSIYAFDTEAAIIEATNSRYRANAGMKVLVKGSMWVENSQGISDGDPVYVEMDGGSADSGKFFNTTSSTRVRLNGAVWRRDTATSGDDIAALRFDLAA